MAILAVSLLAAAVFQTRFENGLFNDPAGRLAARTADRMFSVPRITADAARERSDILFIDARPPADYRAGHIPGAIQMQPSFPPDIRRRLLAGVSPDKTIVVYCDSTHCRLDASLAVMLIDDGYRQVFVLDGGLEAWRSAGFAVDVAVGVPVAGDDANEKEERPDGASGR